MKMLLMYCAKMEKDGYGMTPLLSASVTGHTNIVDFLTHHAQTSKTERINALELLGATFVPLPPTIRGVQSQKQASGHQLSQGPSIIKNRRREDWSLWLLSSYCSASLKT